MAVAADEPPRKFCDAQVRKVTKTLLTFGKTDSELWKSCTLETVDDECARRYLASRSWMASRAVMAITKTIEWRLAFGLHPKVSSRGAWKEGCMNWGWKQQDRPIRLSPVRDTCGRPIVTLSARFWPEDDEEWIHMVIYALEEATEFMRGGKTGLEKSQHPPSDGNIETWLWVVDMEGATLGDAPSLQVLRKLDSILFSHYPGRLQKVLLVNMPVFLRISFALTEILLEDATRSKIVVVDDGPDKLEHYVNPAETGELFGSQNHKTTKSPAPSPAEKPSTPPPAVDFGGLFKCIA